MSHARGRGERNEGEMKAYLSLAAKKGFEALTEQMRSLLAQFVVLTS